MYTEIIDLNESGSFRLYCRLRHITNYEMEGAHPALVLVPGGGFQFCDPNDQEAMVYKFMAYNYHVFTYTYPTGEDYRFPDVIIYLSRALKIIRDHAAQWGVDPHRIVVAGCSAGAHITAALGGIWNRSFIQKPAGCSGEENRPDVNLLCYGPLYCNQKTEDGLIFVPTGDLVGTHTPPTFVSHCADDSGVPVDQSLAYAAQLSKAGVPFSVFISGNGDHGGLQNVKGMINAKEQLTVVIDDWFGVFLKFCDNVCGVSPVPAHMPTFGFSEKLPEEMLAEGEADAGPFMNVPRDENGYQMGTFGAGLKLCFDGSNDESFDNILK